jgi:hypothetical protein
VEKSRARLRTADGVAPANSTGSGDDELRRRTTNSNGKESERWGRAWVGENGERALLPFYREQEGGKESAREGTVGLHGH